MHDVFAAQRQNGEWFSPSDDLLHFIDDLSTLVLYQFCSVSFQRQWRRSMRRIIGWRALRALLKRIAVLELLFPRGTEAVA